MPDGVDHLPGDQHRHDGRLARAGGELQRDPEQVGIGAVIGLLEVFERTAAALAGRGRHFGQPNRRLHGFHLAEEGTDVLEFVTPPMAEQPRGLGRDLPLVGIGQVAPGLDLRPKLVYLRRRVVFLPARRQRFGAEL